MSLGVEEPCMLTRHDRTVTWQSGEMWDDSRIVLTPFGHDFLVLNRDSLLLGDFQEDSHKLQRLAVSVTLEKKNLQCGRSLESI